MTKEEQVASVLAYGKVEIRVWEGVARDVRCPRCDKRISVNYYHRQESVEIHCGSDGGSGCGLPFLTESEVERVKRVLREQKAAYERAGIPHQSYYEYDKRRESRRCAGG